MKEKFELEYTLNSAQKVLFARISTPEGLSEWFADDVWVNGDIFSFIWDDVEYKAQLVAMKDNSQVKFKWVGEDSDDEKYFEFKLNIIELTGDVALLITDFAEEDEKEDAINLWDRQISELKTILGI